jgi:hypothetical protein
VVFGMAQIETFQIRVIEVEALPLENLEFLKNLIKKAALRKLKEFELRKNIKKDNSS